MKDARFTELVHLYIDRQISADEMAELEAEIQRSPARRRTYRDYCRLHRATRLVCEGFRADGELAASGPGSPGGIALIALRARRSRQRWVAAVGGLAAAACVALVFLGFGTGPTPAPAQAPSGDTSPAIAAAPDTRQAAMGAALLALEEPVVIFSSRPAAAPDYTALVAAFRAEQERILSVEPAAGRISLFDDGVFDSPPELLPTRAQPGIAPRRARAAAEFTAFQFQR